MIFYHEDHKGHQDMKLGTLIDLCAANEPFGHSRAGGNLDGWAEILDSRFRGNDVQGCSQVPFAAQSSIISANDR
jgi:hypothetical protein